MNNLYQFQFIGYNGNYRVGLLELYVVADSVDEAKKMFTDEIQTNNAKSGIVYTYENLIIRMAKIERGVIQKFE